ncbi:MAG: hypothetical protein AABZ36_05095 [Nitrospirota bacterium]
MNTTTLKLQNNLEVSCPYRNIEIEICTAAISAMRLSPIARLTYCDNESHDNCPVFLAKVLRRG